MYVISRRVNASTNKAEQLANLLMIVKPYVQKVLGALFMRYWPTVEAELKKLAAEGIDWASMQGKAYLLKKVNEVLTSVKQQALPAPREVEKAAALQILMKIASKMDERKDEEALKQVLETITAIQ